MKISNRYYQLGMALRLTSAVLNTVKTDESNSTRALSGVLEEWLKQNYNTKMHGEPTWRKLVEAVDNPAGGNDHALAKAIAAEHRIGNSFSLFYLCMFIAYTLYMHVCACR